MAGSRKPNPTHITRYERETYGTLDYGSRFSHYEHGMKVPAEHLDEIARKGFVRVEETHAEEWGRVLDDHDDDANPWDDNYRKHVERMAGDAGLASVTTWSVGHIVWPGKEDVVCRECPYGSAT